MFGSLQLALAKLLIIKEAIDFKKRLPYIPPNEQQAAITAHEARIKKLDSIITNTKLI